MMKQVINQTRSVRHFLQTRKIGNNAINANFS